MKVSLAGALVWSASYDALIANNEVPAYVAITVQRCSGSSCTAFVAVAQLAATANSWTDSGVKSRSTYRYRMFASNDAGKSPYSSIASATAR